MRTFKVLTLTDEKLGLDDLFEKRHAAFTKSKAGKLYETALGKKRAELASLPTVLLAGKPLAAELAETDRRHDGFGAAIYFYTEAVARLPDASPAVVAAARRIRAAFVPTLDTLRASFADEAKAAETNRKRLKDLKADLDLFPVPGNGNKTLSAWAATFIDAGDDLKALLSHRADLSEGDRAHATKLRTTLIALLNRFRAALDDELEHDDTLPRNLDAKVFGFLDELESLRGAGGGASAPAQEDGAPEAPTNASGGAAAGTTDDVKPPKG